MPNIALAPLGLAHVEATFRWTNDPEVRENLGLRAAPTRESTEAFVKRALTDESIRAFAIEVDGAHVGNVVLDRIDRHNGMAHLHIYIGEAAGRGKGIGTKATALAAEHAFREVGLHKVWLTVHEDNARAIAAYKRAGFQVEGTLRDEFLFRGARLNAIYMGRLRTDPSSDE